MTYSAEVLADSPYGYWRQGEASGTTMADASGNGRTGAYGHPDGFTAPTLGATSLLVGDSDTAATYTAGSHTAYYTTGNLTGSAASIELIYKRSGGAGSGSRYALLGRGEQVQIYLTSGGVPRARVAAGGTTYETSTSGVSAINDGNAHHVVLSWNGTTLKLYVDGAEVASTAAAGSFDTADGKTRFHIATAQDASGYAGYTNGTFDEVAFYTTALSGARVTAHYNASIGSGATVNGSASLTGTGTLTASGGVVAPTTVNGSASLIGNGTLTASGAVPSPTTVYGSASLSGEGLLTVAGDPVFVPFEPPTVGAGFPLRFSARLSPPLSVDVDDVVPFGRVASSVSEDV